MNDMDAPGSSLAAKGADAIVVPDPATPAAALRIPGREGLAAARALIEERVRRGGDGQRPPSRLRAGLAFTLFAAVVAWAVGGQWQLWRLLSLRGSPLAGVALDGGLARRALFRAPGAPLARELERLYADGAWAQATLLLQAAVADPASATAGMTADEIDDLALLAVRLPVERVARSTDPDERVQLLRIAVMNHRRCQADWPRRPLPPLADFMALRARFDLLGGIDPRVAGADRPEAGTDLLAALDLFQARLEELPAAERERPTRDMLTMATAVTLRLLSEYNAKYRRWRGWPEAAHTLWQRAGLLVARLEALPQAARDRDVHLLRSVYWEAVRGQLLPVRDEVTLGGTTHGRATIEARLDALARER